jgi:hypothetical protein
MAKIIAAGATGFIGNVLLKQLLEAGNEVVLLTRRPGGIQLRHPNLRTVLWDGKNVGVWAAEADGAKAIVNLCGAPIADKPWTEERKREILNSRIYPLQALVQAAVRSADPPKLIITASAVGFYGNVPSDQPVTESRGRGEGFLADVCAQWEKAAEVASSFGVRVVCLRFGVVLAPDGGALAKFLPAFKAYIGGPLGSGRQALPWIHREDAAAAISSRV